MGNLTKGALSIVHHLGLTARLTHQVSKGSSRLSRVCMLQQHASAFLSRSARWPSRTLTYRKQNKHKRETLSDIGQTKEEPHLTCWQKAKGNNTQYTHAKPHNHTRTLHPHGTAVKYHAALCCTDHASPAVQIEGEIAEEIRQEFPRRGGVASPELAQDCGPELAVPARRLHKTLITLQQNYERATRKDGRINKKCSSEAKSDTRNTKQGRRASKPVNPVK